MRNRRLVTRAGLPSQTFDHHCVDRITQLPPTVWQLKEVAVRCGRGQVEVYHGVELHFQMACCLDTLSLCRWW